MLQNKQELWEIRETEVANSFQTSYNQRVQKVKQLSDAKSTEELWCFRFAEPFAQTSLIVKGRHAIVTYNSSDKVYFQSLPTRYWRKTTRLDKATFPPISRTDCCHPRLVIRVCEGWEIFAPVRRDDVPDGLFRSESHARQSPVSQWNATKGFVSDR